MNKTIRVRVEYDCVINVGDMPDGERLTGFELDDAINDAVFELLLPEGDDCKPRLDTVELIAIDGKQYKPLT